MASAMAGAACLLLSLSEVMYPCTGGLFSPVWPVTLPRSVRFVGH